jgi:hypothetical protein
VVFITPGTSPRTLWQDKWNSMERGFAAENFAFGVPMIPKPKSEAWLLCAVQKNYQHCDFLEEASGNDDSPNALKTQLVLALSGTNVKETSVKQQLALFEEGKIDVSRINMKSFNAFKNRLYQVLKKVAADM